MIDNQHTCIDNATQTAGVNPHIHDSTVEPHNDHLGIKSTAAISRWY